MSYVDEQFEPASPFAGIEDRNELARCILRSGQVHDPDIADLVARAASGSGEDSLLLRAMIPDPDDDEAVLADVCPFAPVDPPLPAMLYREGPRALMRAMKVNPFIKPPDVLPLPLAVQGRASRKASGLRSAVLTDEAARLYRCLSFAMNWYGVVMNGHMTVAWEVLGIRDHVGAAKVLTEFNARMGKWLKVDGSGRKRKGIKSTTWGVPDNYFYAFVHEHTRDHGFHTHQLIAVSDGKARAFAERAVPVLKRLTGVSHVPANAVVFTPGTKGEGFVPYLPRFKKNEVERCWIWFRYLAKNLSPHEFARAGDRCVPQRDVFRIRRVFVPPHPVSCSDLFGCSQNIGVGAQMAAGFVSKFDQGDWQRLYDDSDLAEWRRAKKEQQRQEEMAAIFANITI
jgi:hypothetical protein